jgi:hypothetical protein
VKNASEEGKKRWTNIQNKENIKKEMKKKGKR